MELVDTHCHIQSINATKGEDHTRELWNKAKTNIEEVIDSASTAGVKTLVLVGCDVDDSTLAAETAYAKSNCFWSAGIHPHESKQFVNDQSEKNRFASLVNRPKLVAIGECGLDYFYTHSKPDDQEKILRFQLELALERGLPLIFHVREAFQDFWPIFDSYGSKLKGVLHSFTDSAKTLDQALERGLYIGVNGIATFTKNPAQLSMYKAVPSDRLLLETDSPYLTPTPYRGTINEPKHIRTIGEFIAELRGEGLQEIAEATTANAHLLFGI